MKIIILSILLLLPHLGYAEELPKVSVTDLTYKKELNRQIHFFSGQSKATIKAKGHINERENESLNHYAYSKSQELGDVDSDKSFEITSGDKDISYIQVGELRKFTGDIKGEMLKSGSFRLIQGKPYISDKQNEEIYDVIQRIKSGYYKGADYVLFGTLSEMQWRNEANPVQDTDVVSKMLSLELIAEFSLIDTKTYEIKSAFSAIGEGQDMKLIKSDAHLKLSSTKVVRDVSKSLASDVVKQLLEQLGVKAVSNQ